MESIICRKCKISKASTEYIKSLKYKGGYMYDCKDCYSTHRKNLENIKKSIKDTIHITNKETNQIINNKTIKKCSLCKINKQIDQSFSKTKNGYSSKCNDCFSKFREIVRKVQSDTKICILCKEEKKTADFYRHKKTNDGYKERCIECCKITQYSTEENKKRDERYLRDQIKQCSSCKEEKPFTEFTADINCKFGIKSKCKLCSQLIKRNYANNKKQTNPIYKLECNLRSRIRSAINQKRSGGTVKSAKTIELLGAPINDVYKHLEAQFKQGMTWENYGKWHVDHILPCSSFDLGKAEEQLKCFNYKNLQPLWATDNLKKHAKII